MLSSSSAGVQESLFFAGIGSSWHRRGASRPGLCGQGLGLAEHDGPEPLPLEMVQLNPSHYITHPQHHLLRGLDICTEKDRAQYTSTPVPLYGKDS